MIEQSPNNSARSRIYWLDNLRTFMIFLVVLTHTALIYEKYSLGGDWWIVCDPSASDLPGILFLILNIFVMAPIFFIAGFLTPGSVENKSGWSFVKSKFKRLIIPWMIAVVTLIPLYKIIFLFSRGLPQESWTTYFHWNATWSQNWLWFLPVLFLFEILYLFLSKLNLNIIKISLKRALWSVFLLSFLFSFLMDYFGLQGWTKTLLIDFQNERIFIYFLVFLLGALCYQLKVFESKWKNKKLDQILHWTGWLPINLYCFFVIYALVKPDDPLISEVVDTILIRLNYVAALGYLLYVMISVFSSYVNKQSRIFDELNKNSYSVYIIHVIVMGGLASMLLQTGIPSLLKFLTVTVLTWLMSNLMVSLYRKVTGSKT